MREILFRGKRPDEDRWRYGDLDTTGAGITRIRTREDDGIRVEPETIGQFTGLTDKNGKKIFEGDIIRVNYEADRMPENEPEIWSETYEVVFDDKYHAWFTKLNDRELGEWLYEYDGGCEVIGNIHDNPELLNIQ